MNVDDVEALRSEIAGLKQERESWKQEKGRLTEEIETLSKRCQKLARLAAASRSDAANRVGAEVQTDPVELTIDSSGIHVCPGTDLVSNDASVAALASQPIVDQMMRNPTDEALQMEGIKALFAQQTQIDGASTASSATSLRSSFEASVAVFANHRSNRTLLLKACQLLSVLLAEPGAQQQLPTAVLFYASQAVVGASTQLISDISGEVSAPGAGTSSPIKLLDWFFSLLKLLLPCIGATLRSHEQSEAFVETLFADLVNRTLSSVELASHDALILKCVQMIPLLPMEPWIQNACVSTGVIRVLSLTHSRKVGCCVSNGTSTVDLSAESDFRKAIQVAVRGAFADNVELCVKAVDDTFVDEFFICLEVLDQLRTMEKRRRGILRDLDKDHDIIAKSLALWAFHERATLEASDPKNSPSKEVLCKVASLITAVILKLTPQILLQRMREFEQNEVFQRLALAAIHSNPQLRLQAAVNYADNGISPVIIACTQMIIQGYEGPPSTPAAPAVKNIQTAFALLEDDFLPSEGWPYFNYCLEVCLHILSHWSAARLSSQRADVLDAKAAPLMLAQGGLVEVLVGVLDPKGAGMELRQDPPKQLRQKTSETIQALFEQNGHICLFCMQHYADVKQMVALGCDSLSADPLTDFPDLQQQAVMQLISAFEKFAVEDEHLGGTILKALNSLFESSYSLVAWYLQQHPLETLEKYQSTDVHLEAVRSVCRAPYWSAEDAPLLPTLVAMLSRLLLDSLSGVCDEPIVPALDNATVGKRRILEFEEAEQIVAACTASVLHLLLIDPCPPAVLHVFSRTLAGLGAEDTASESNNPVQEDNQDEHAVGDERAVNLVMRIMQVFPLSDRVQMNSQHLLSSLLGE